MQFAFPMIAIELVSELAMGILMRIIPQINVFTVNFQVKIIMGLLMMLLLFSPMADYRYHLYIYVSDDVEAFKQYETSLKGVS